MATASFSFTATASFFVTGGTVPVSAASYVVRQSDADLYDAINAGKYCYVLNTRQMGKSSLMVRTAKRLKLEGDTVCVLDLTAVGNNLTPEQWYDGLLYRIAEQTDSEDALEAFWAKHERLSPMQRFFEAVGKVILPKTANRLVLFIDEIDAVRSLPFSANEFFAGLRECFNRRTTDPLYTKLAVCLLGVATPADLISDTRVSPFNIGQRIVVTDFTADEAAPFALNMGGNGNIALRRVLHGTGGHPYLTQRLCRECDATGTSTALDVDKLANTLFLGKSVRETDDNLSFVRNRLLRSEYTVADVLDLYGRVFAGKPVTDDDSSPLCAILRLSGVCKTDPDTRLMRVRNRIYERVFDRVFIKENMPGAERRRQQQAVNRARWQVGAIAGIIMTAFVSLGLLLRLEQGKVARTMRLSHEAEAKRIVAETRVADMSRKVSDVNKEISRIRDESRRKAAEVKRLYNEGGRMRD